MDRFIVLRLVFALPFDLALVVLRHIFLVAHAIASAVAGMFDQMDDVVAFVEDVRDKTEKHHVKAAAKRQALRDSVGNTINHL